MVSRLLVLVSKVYYWDWILLNKQIRAADFRCWQDVPVSFRLTSFWRHHSPVPTSAAQATTATVVLKQRNLALWVASSMRACSFWWSQRNCFSISVVVSECRVGSSEGYRMSMTTHRRAELQVLLMPLTRRDSVLSKHESDDFLIVLLVSSLDFCSQIFDCSEYFASPVWFCLQELTLLANVRLWQARSLVTTMVPRGPLALSLPLKCVHYTVVDNKQKDG